jgi:hypothetical protein
MAHWAELDNDNVVVRVLVTNNNDQNGDEGYQWLLDVFGGRWIKTSYNGTIRKNFASIGFVYDEAKDAFIAPQPYASWILNPDTCRWEAPVSYPENGLFVWDEDSLNWIEVV